MFQQLPAALLTSLQTVKGFDESAFVKTHQSGEQVVSVRLNPNKIFNLQSSIFNAQLEKVQWSSAGYYLPERPSFTADPLFHAGAYYVQEASSMFLEEALKQTEELTKSLKVLDLCAAPGGKSTLIQSLLSTESLLISNEIIKTRVTILAENITKWGAANVIVTNNDPKDFQRLENYFDAIVVDAPCSGSGLFRKDPAAIEEWSENNVQLCSQRQQRILADVFPALKEDGVIIYSTCSYSMAEDEAIADWLVNELKMVSCSLQIPSDWNIVETSSPMHNAYGYRFYPDKVKGEGFFIAAFKKQAQDNKESKKSKPKHPSAGRQGKSEKVTAQELTIVQPYLKTPQELCFIKQREEILAMPASLEQELLNIQSSLYIKKAGVKLGAVIRNELIPDHELAVSVIAHPAIPAIAVSRENALQYLRREELQLEVQQKGWFLLTYEGLPLGWIKSLPNRINNYYPKDWRILNK